MANSAHLAEPSWRSAASRCARLALDCVHREFPNHPLVVMADAEDVRRPREHTPAFFGCFDWHSAVHGHWTLVRLARFFPEEPWAEEAVAAVRQSLTAENLRLELKFVSKPGREGFERPYGLAWLLQLAIELREWGHPDGVQDMKRHLPSRDRQEAHSDGPDSIASSREGRRRTLPDGRGSDIHRQAVSCTHPDAAAMSAAIHPLEQHCRNRLAEWLPKLTHPIRSGEHSQTAFAMGLAFDWARCAGDQEFAELLRRRSLDFYGSDVDLPLRFEPSGHDFLSPSLAEADLMRRVLPREEFATWLDAALPFDEAHAPRSPVAPVEASDRADGKLAHLDGLNLSRAWMLEGIASALEASNPRKAMFEHVAEEHAAAGLAAVTGEHYAGGHWLGTFATYSMTKRGIELS